MRPHDGAPACKPWAHGYKIQSVSTHGNHQTIVKVCVYCGKVKTERKKMKG